MNDLTTIRVQHTFRMHRLLAACLCVVCAMATVVTAQPSLNERDIRARLDAIYAGKAAEVRAELPSLLSRYPNDAGVRYIQAVLTADGPTAAKRYDEIAQKFPESVWADDALYKLYQYHFSIGLYKKADSVMTHLRSTYPRSIYVQSQNGALPTAPAGTPAAGGSVKKEETGSAKKQDAPAEKKQDAGAVKHQDEPAQKKQTDAAAAKQPVPVQKKQAETPAKKQEPAQTPAANAEQGASGAYVVQAGYFSSEANAKKAAERYSALAGREARIRTRTSGEKTMYLVFFDGFDTQESAQRFSAELRTKHNIDSFVSPR